MTSLDQAVSLHPDTVTKVSTGELRPPRPRRQKQEVATDTRSVKVNELAWAAALAHCGGVPRRIEVVDENTVVVHNNPDWRRAVSP